MGVWNTIVFEPYILDQILNFLAISTFETKKKVEDKPVLLTLEKHVVLLR